VAESARGGEEVIGLSPKRGGEAGEQTLTVDGDHNSTSLGYDANLVPLQQVFNSLGTLVYSQSYGYDAAGEMVSGIDGDNHTRSYYYDGGNLVSESWYAGNGTFQQALNFSYDLASFSRRATAPAATPSATRAGC
jgi:YD repeat-containing protein